MRRANPRRPRRPRRAHPERAPRIEGGRLCCPVHLHPRVWADLTKLAGDNDTSRSWFVTQLILERWHLREKF